MTEHEHPSHEDLSLLGIGSPDLSSLINIVLRDDLTDLYNRRYFRRRLEEERQRVENDQASMAIIMMDIDRFKMINDTYGHLKGDDVLVRVGKIIGATVRSIDIVCRYAGDEFVAILPSAGRREAGKIARRIEQAVEEHDWSAELGGTVSVGISAGYAAFPGDAKSLEALIQKADSALYRKKRRRAERVGGREGEASSFQGGSWSNTEVPPLLERRTELARLKSLFEKSRLEKPVFTLIEGPAGSGKSRLVEEFLKRTGRMSMFVCRGSSTEGTKQMPLFPVREALASLHRSDPDVFTAVCEKLEHSSLKQLSRILPPGLLDRHGSDDGPSDRNHLFATLARFFHTVADRCPVVLVFEDLQWADEGTLEFLAFLESVEERSRLFVIATLRHGSSPLPGSEGDTGSAAVKKFESAGWKSIRLKNLSGHATERLVKYYLDTKRVPQVFSRDLHRITGGNPVFIRETLVYLVGQDKIDRVLEHGLGSREGEPVIPLSILEMIKGRFKDLDQPVQRMLQAASVLGYDFEARHLLVLMGQRENEIYGLLDAARRQNFIDEHFDEKVERFSFNNNLTRDVIYHETNMRKRKFYHQRIGEVLEKETGHDDVASLERLAHHFGFGERPGKAYRYLVRAGEKARELYANMESIRFFERAIEMAARTGDGAVDGAEIRDLRETIGDLFQHIGSIDDAKRTYTNLLAEEGIDGARNVRLLRKLGELHEKECRYNKALTFLYRALNSLRDQTAPEYKYTVLALSVVFMRKGEADKALHYSQRLLDSDDGEDETLTAKLNFIIGSCHLCRGLPRSALPYFKTSMKIRERSSDLVSLGLTYVNVGNCLFHLGRRKAALRFWRRGKTIGRRTSNAFLEMACRNNIVLAFELRENPEQALTSLGEALKLARKMGNAAAVASCRTNIAAVYREVGRLEDAAGEFSRCLEMGEKMDNLEIVVKSTINLGTVYMEIGELEKAENYAWKSLELTTKNRMKNEEAMSWELLGDVNMQRAHYTWAVDTFQRAKKCIEKVTAPGDEGRLIVEGKLCEAAAMTESSPGWEEKVEAAFSGIVTEKEEARLLLETGWGSVLLLRGGDGGRPVDHLRRAAGLLGEESPRTMLRLQIFGLLARGLEAAGRTEEARAAAGNAGRALEVIKNRFRSRSLLDTFLSRRDVREFLLLRERLKI